MVSVQKWPYFQLFFLRNIGHGNVFYDILERNNGFVGYKNKKFKNSKNWHFSKGFNAWFWSENYHFSKFIFWQYRPRKCLLRYSRRKNASLVYKNKQFKRSKNLHFSKGVNPCFWSKTGHFSNFFFLGNIGQENVSYDILEQKKHFYRLQQQEVQTVQKFTFF